MSKEHTPGHAGPLSFIHTEKRIPFVAKLANGSRFGHWIASQLSPDDLTLLTKYHAAAIQKSQDQGYPLSPSQAVEIAIKDTIFDIYSTNEPRTTLLPAIQKPPATVFIEQHTLVAGQPNAEKAEAILFFRPSDALEELPTAA